MIKKALFASKKIIAVIALVFFAGIFFVACSPKTEAAYEISGYVFDELGDAVKDVEIKSDLGTVLTDENGKYTIAGVTSSLILQASKEDYQFAEVSKLVSKSTDDANFTAYKNYTVSGTVNNNGVMVSNATVKIESLSGKFYTTTDSDGVFYGKDVAGKAIISCSKDGYDYYPVTADIASPNVSVNITTSVKINFKTDADNFDYSDIKLFINDKPQLITGSEVVLTDIRCRSVIRIESSKYVFNKKQFVVSSLNQAEEIFASEIYSISGRVISGNIPLSGAIVSVGSKTVTTNSFGTFTIPELIGENVVSASYSGLNFEDKTVNNKLSLEDIEFNGTKVVSLNLNYDVELAEDLKISGASYEKLSANKYKLVDVALGTNIHISSESYHLLEQDFEISDANTINISAFAKYSANVSVKDGLSATILLDGKQTTLDQLNLLYGTHEVSAVYENYVFDKVSVDFYNSNITLNYIIPYSVSLHILSGDVLVKNASASVNGKQILSENGVIKINNLINENTITIQSSGYDVKEVKVSAAGDYNVNLTYFVSGIVKTGTNPVVGARVFAGENSTTTNANGEYLLSGLSGTIIIEVQKDHYNFSEALEVSKQEDVWFSGSYNISGTLSNDTGVVSGLTVVLRNDTTAQEQRVESDENGAYSFENLTESYFLFTIKNGSLSELKPNSYNIIGGGVYDFNLNGFAVSGRVVSGNMAVAGAYVTAGASSTVSDEDGYFTFELLTETCEIFVQKTGYDFSGSIVEVSDNVDDIIIDGTYSVSGKIIISGNAISDVNIYSNGALLATSNEAGEFTAIGLRGTQELEFSKEGYVFESVIVSETGNLNITCKIKVSLSVFSGNNAVCDVKYYINGLYAGIINDSKTEIIANFGDIISFEKLGYVIENVTVTEPKTYVASSTYSVSGKVLSANVPVSGVSISVSGQTVITNKNGEFSLSGLAGNIVLSLSKTGYDFSQNIQISGYEANVQIQSTYSVSGKILLGEKANSGVVITYNNTQVVSDKDGNFEINNISGKYSLSFQKEGYTFDLIEEKFGTDEILVGSYYIVSGRVMSGSEPVSFAEVVATISNSSKTISASADANGNFTITGLTGNAILVITKQGYSSAQIANISGYTTNVSANLTYSITIRFDTEGVLVIQNSDKKYQVSGKEITISELEGINTFTFEKKYTKFSRTSLTVKEPPETELPTITTSVAYNITGSVKTEGGVAVAGITVYAGSTSIFTKTDSNGNFAFNSVVGDLFVKDGTYNSSSQRIDGERAYNFVVSNPDFAYWIYSTGISNLDNAASVQIFGNGNVDAGAGGTQKVYSLFKRDNKGNIIKQNLNLGKEVFGINPTVAVLTVYDASNDTYKYNRNSNVSSDMTSRYDSLSSQSANFFKSTYGAYPYEYGPYNITKDTITGVSISTNSSGNYVVDFSLTLNSQDNYKKQIVGLAPGGTTFKEFKYLRHSYEISKSGWIVKLYADEQYVVNKVVNATTTSKFTYYYKTYAKNLKIDDLNFSNNDTIQQSLKESKQTEIAENSVNSFGYDIVSKTIFG